MDYFKGNSEYFEFLHQAKFALFHHFTLNLGFYYFLSYFSTNQLIFLIFLDLLKHLGRCNLFPEQIQSTPGPP